MNGDDMQDSSSLGAVPPSEETADAGVSAVLTTGSESVDVPPETSEKPQEGVTAGADKDENSGTGSGEVQVGNSPPAAFQPPAESTPPPSSFLHDLLLRARAKIQERKQKKLDKIMDVVAKKGKVSNHDVRKMMYVSAATANRYLNILEHEGRVRQTGTKGEGVYYVKM